VKNPRIVGALLVGIALVVGAFYVRTSAAETPQEAAIAVADTPRQYIPTQDSDQDGMRDWEEELYGTNPERADSFTKTQTSTSSAPAYDDLPDTVTKKFAINFFSDYLQSAATGKEMDDETKAQFLQDAATYATEESADRLFTSADLTLGTSNDAAAIREYGNRAAEALTKYTVSSKENEIMILEHALQTDNKADLAPLTGILDSYNKSLSDLLIMTAPPALADEHLELLNDVLALRNNIAAMQRTFEDALPAMVRFQRHPDDIVRLKATLGAIAMSLQLHGASYGSDEPGSFWSAFTP
jgi:hypothetical protein